MERPSSYIRTGRSPGSPSKKEQMSGTHRTWQSPILERGGQVVEARLKPTSKRRLLHICGSTLDRGQTRSRGGPPPIHRAKATAKGRLRLHRMQCVCQHERLQHLLRHLLRAVFQALQHNLRRGNRQSFRSRGAVSIAIAATTANAAYSPVEANVIRCT